MGLFDKIKAGLKKTRENIGGQINSMLGAFSKIDDELFEELEELLVMGDVGVSTATKICDELRQRVKDRGVTDPNQIMGLLQELVAEMLGGLKDRIRCVRGNCDGPLEQEKLGFDMEPYVIIPVVRGVIMYATHGHKFHSENRPAGMREGDILLQGHTHHNMLQKRGGFIYMNPGSAADPRHDDERGYMTMENGAFTWKRLDGTEYRRYEVKP